MRVLLVNSYLYDRGGDTTHTFALAQLLRDRGHDVAFFAMQHPQNLPDPDSDLFVSYIDFRDSLRRKRPMDGVRVLTRAIYSGEARRKFGQIVDRFHPDLVHFQNIHGHITPSVVFEAKNRQLPTVWTLHDYKMLCPNSHFLVDKTAQVCEACADGAFFNALLKRCKKGSLLASGVAMVEAYAHRAMRVSGSAGMYITPSRFLRRKLLDHGFPPERVAHVPLFLPDGAFCGGSDSQGYILFLGRLEPFKGIVPLAKASRYVPNVRVVLAGSADRAVEKALEAILPANVTYVGVKRGEELRQLLRGATALVLPSLCYENQPFSILEAFAAAKPVIASAIGGMTELVVHEERGLLVPPGEEVALAKAMSWIANHPEESRAMGERAYSYVAENHSAAVCYTRLEAIYERVCGSSWSSTDYGGGVASKSVKEVVR